MGILSFVLQLLKTKDTKPSSELSDAGIYNPTSDFSYSSSPETYTPNEESPSFEGGGGDFGGGGSGGDYDSSSDSGSDSSSDSGSDSGGGGGGSD